MQNNSQSFAAIPMQLVGPLKLQGDVVCDDLMVPLATFESPLWASVARGARVSARAGGIKVALMGSCMTRSVVLEANSVFEARAIRDALADRQEEMADRINLKSRYARLTGVHTEVIGRLLYLRLAFSTGDAAGHNMATQAADAIIDWLLQNYSGLRYISISANYCTDKKVSAVNGILGRGRNVTCEVEIPRELCSRLLRTTPELLAELQVKKNLLGSVLAGSLRSANAHVANMLLAVYLATGQDAANIVEGSQAVNHVEVTASGDLYFSVNLPNLVMGTVGNGKAAGYVRDNLRLLGCAGGGVEPGANAARLACITAAVCLCGELSLMAAQTNQGELMKTHLKLERKADDPS